jgi:predicted rRNA methylase YqxC with S4 and FtsJ domains
LAAAVPQLETLRIGSEALMVALVKPMFELHLDRPPIDESILLSAVDVASSGISANGRWRVIETMRSPQLGARGAVEFFVYAARER